MRRFLAINLLSSIILLGLLIVSSCKDDEQDPNPNKPPQVTVSSPIDGASINSKEPFPLTLSIQQSADIVSYRVLIRDRSSGEAIFFISEFTESRKIDIDTLINLCTIETSNMDIEVQAEDSFGNQIDETVSSFILNPPDGNVFTLKFNLKYDGDVLLMNKEYVYPTGEVFEFSRFGMYLTDLTLMNGSEETVIKNLDYLSMTEAYGELSSANEGYSYSVAGLDDGTYTGIKFNIGLTPSLNSTTPNEYPVSHPLGAIGDYWGSWNSYIFASIEGRINLDTTNPDLEKGIALHLGSDEAFRIISIPTVFELNNNENEVLNIDIDLKNLFIDEQENIYDIASTPATHSLEQLPMVIQLATNLKNSINK